MPVAEFPGDFGWGYDGVDLFAPTRLYGTPDDFRALRRSRARARPRRHPRRRLQPPRPGRQLPAAVLAGLLHRPLRERVGRGDQLRRRRTAGPVREFFVANAGYWIDEFHLDGLRLDATQDDLRRLAGAHPRGDRRSARASGAGARSIVVVAENEPQDTRLVRPPDAGRLRPRRALERRLPPQRDGRADRPRRGVLHATTAARRRSSSRPPSTGYLYQGQRYRWQKKRARHAGARTSPPAAFVDLPRRTTTRSPTRRAACALHQLTSPGRYRAMTALLLLGAGDADAVPGPGVRRVGAVPLLRRPRAGARRSWCATGRAEFLAQFPEPRRRRGAGRARRPGDRARRSSAASSTSPSASAHARGLRAAPRPAAAAPRGPGVPRAARAAASTARCSAPAAFVLRFFGRRAATTGCCSSTSAAISTLAPCAEPLLAPPAGTRLGGCAGRSEDAALRRQRHAAARCRRAGWRVPGESARCCSRRGARPR